jgi:DNA repair exonuclease SbcCD ATPase subunit
MIQIKDLTVKNFMSVGNATQAINFDRQDLTLVIGENLDLGGDGSRNGTGKTTIINALSYALFGSALTNIRKDNLINKTNGKNMMVSLDFSINGQEYRIERGRKPNVLKFYVDSHEQESTDESQGDSRETQQAIEKLLGLSHDMFKHVLALNTYTEPFLSMRQNDQRQIIEQLLGITLLSERAESIKEQMRQTKDAQKEEEMRIRAVQEANKRIEDQIVSLKNRRGLWGRKKTEDVEGLTTAIDSLSHVNIDDEINAHRALDAFYNTKKAIEDANKWIRSIEQDNGKLSKLQLKLEKEIEDLESHKCYACGQELHDNKHEEILASKRETLQETAQQILANQTQEQEHRDGLAELGELGTAPTVFYDTMEQAYEHQNTLSGLQQQLESRNAETDPYSEQIEEMEHQALQEVSYDTINNLTRLQEHQDFLLKLLTNKDSFVRKRIIDQNLSYLNSRLTHYLDRIGLPHTVIFQNDLSVEIQELGRDLDFDNLSRGERNRLILSMSWAFRDVWESLYGSINLLFIDELVDSGMDTSGVENALGLLKHMARERHKSVWLVSHKDELAGRVHNILKVVKENGFTNYNTDVDIL